MILESRTTHFKVDYNIPHREKSVQSQGILKQLVPNLVGRVLGPVGCQKQNHEAWKPDWAESWRTIFCKGEWFGPYTKHHVNLCELIRLATKVMYAIEFNIFLSHRLFFI